MSEPRPFELQAEYEPAGDQPAGDRFARRRNSVRPRAPDALLGVTGSGKTYSIANVIQAIQRPTLVLVHNKTLAAQLYGEFKTYFPRNSVEYFVSYYDYYQPEAYVPSSDTYIEKDASINEHIEQMRLSATKALLERPDSIIVATVSAIYGLGDPESYLKMVLHLVRGDRMDYRQLLRRLADMQYTRNELDLRQGTFRVRGDVGVVDIFPAESERDAVRVQFFDEEIESLRSRPLDRRGIAESSSADGLPVDALRDAAGTPARRGRRDQGRVAQPACRAASRNKLVEAQRLEQRTLFDLEMIAEASAIAPASRITRATCRAANPANRLRASSTTCRGTRFWWSMKATSPCRSCRPCIAAIARARRRWSNTGSGCLPRSTTGRCASTSSSASSRKSIYVSATPAERELREFGEVVEQVVRPTGLVDPAVEVRPVATQVDDLLSEIRIRVERNERVLVTTLTKAQDLTEYLDEHGVKVRYLHSDIETVERVEIIRDLRLAKFDVLVGINLLREGLDLPEVLPWSRSSTPTRKDSCAPRAL